MNASPQSSEMQARPVTSRPQGVDPSPLFQLATGYWAPATLLAANELGVPAALAEGAQSSQVLAARLNLNQPALERLLNACCALGIITQQAGSYALTPLAAMFLVPGRPGSMVSALRWSHQQYQAWGQLAKAVRQGAPVVSPEEQLGDDPEQTRVFVQGMHERAAGVARAVVEHIDLEGCESLLDVGGGPGTYAMLLARKYPRLRVTVLDLPAIVAIARELIAEAGLTDRTGVLAGDGTDGVYGEACCDAVLMSGVLHRFAPATIQRMVAGAHRALRQGGRIIISDVMLEAAKTRSAFATLFGLQMLLTTADGDVFSADECARWLSGAGFVDVGVKQLPPPLPYYVISARKAATG